MSTISNTPVSDFDAAVRLLSGGTNVVIYNDIGLPSIYVRRDKGLISDVISGGSDLVHPAFRVNLVDVPAFYMGKYLATVYKGRALSLPLQDPAANIVSAENKGSATTNKVNFDNAKLWCEANGAGFHLPTIAEYAWIALLSRINGTMPRGNNSFGSDGSALYEKGIPSMFDANGKARRTLTGSGPASWNDNWRPDGICDLNGNVYELQGGYRVVDGELQVFNNNDAALHYEQNAESTRWQAIHPDGTLATPGTAGTLKWDYTTDPVAGVVTPFCLNNKVTHTQTSETPYGGIVFSQLVAADGVNVPELLKALALMPDGNSADYGDDYVFMRHRGEFIASRGGRYDSSGGAGVFSTRANMSRLYSEESMGFRPAFIPGI